MPKLSQAQRLGLLTSALSAWVEGSTQLRNIVLCLIADIPVTTSSWPDQPYSNDWKANVLNWLTRPSRELDYGEKAAIAGFDLTSALVILRVLQIKPLLPFLLTPILATVPLPRTFSARSLQTISWFPVILTIFVTTLIQESHKVTLLQSLRFWRRYQIQQRKLALGKIVARGAPLRTLRPVNEDEEDEELECLICTGLGTEENDLMARSISSLSSAPFETGGNNPSGRQDQGFNQESFGPLEEFCVTAPHKHVAHRTCLLQWVEAYRQQQSRIFLEPVNVQYQNPSEMESTLRTWGREEQARIKTFLQAAGFQHILPLLIFPSSSTNQGSSNGSNRTTTSGDNPVSTATTTLSRFPVNIQPRTSNLTVTTQTLDSPQSHRMISSGPLTLATLQTSSPSCPACRGPVRILFTKESTAPRSTGRASRQLTDASFKILFFQRWLRVYSRMQGFAKGWWKECGASITGRSLLVRLAAQYSFLIVLVSMIKASGRGAIRK